MSEFRLYWRYVRMHSNEYFQFRGWPLGLLVLLLNVATDPIDLLLMLDRFGSMGSWSAVSILSMYGLALGCFGLSELFGRGFDYFPGLIRDGSFDRILLRPRSLFVQAITLRFHPQRAGRALVGLGLMVWALRAQGVVFTPMNLLILAGAIGGGMMVYIGIFIFFSAIAFFTIESMDVVNIFTNGSYQVAKVPPQYLPGWIRGAFCFLMPMLAFSYYPLASVCGWNEPYALGFLALPVGAAFMGLSLVAFRFGVKHYRSAGG